MKPYTKSKNPWTDSQQTVLNEQTSLWGTEKISNKAALKTNKNDTSEEQTACSRTFSANAGTYQSPIVLTGEQKLSNGKTIYLVFEQITDKNEPYWKYYIKQFAICYGSYGVNTIAVAYAEKYLTENKWLLGTREAFLNYLEVSFSKRGTKLPKERSLHSFCKRLYVYLSNTSHQQTTQTLYSKIKTLLEEVRQGVQGDLVRASENGVYNFMVYASAEPIHDEDIQSHYEFVKPKKQAFFNLEPHNNKIMSVPFQAAKKEPTFTHFGLFKNPWHMIDTNRSYHNTSVILKGFSANCVKDLTKTIPEFGEKTYFSTAPLRSLTKILGKAIGDKNIHMVVAEKSHHEVYGLDISKKWPDETYTIEDPDYPGIQTPHLARLNYAGYNPGLDIIIKAERLEPFYEKSKSIHDAKAMLRSLKHLKSYDSELPEGLKELICKTFPEIKKEVTLDKAIKHYLSLDKALDDEKHRISLKKPSETPSTCIIL